MDAGLNCVCPCRNLFQFAVFCVADRFEPFSGSVFARNAEGKVCEPRIGGSAVPVLDVGWYMYDSAGQYFNGRLAFFLIPSAACYTYEHLASAFCCFVYVPVVTTAGFEGYVGEWNLRIGYLSQVAVSGEVLGECVVWLAYGENHLALECGLGVVAGGIVGPYFFCNTESCPCGPLWRVLSALAR